MFDTSPTRAPDADCRKARINPVTAASLFGGVLGLAVGCAYLGGTMTRASVLRSQAERLENATSAGFTEEALAAAAGGLDDSALSIARRHDPYTVAGAAQRDRQAELLTARLETLRTSGLRQASFNAVGAIAQPFRMASALDSSRDLECLTQAAYYEARGEGGDGMKAVAQVVLNRVRHPAFPKSVCAVVFQGAGRRTGCQFSFTCDGSMRAAVNAGAWRRARSVASAALAGSVYGGVGNATHFHTLGVAPAWRTSLIRVNQVGQHLFYRFGGRAGGREAFTYAARPSVGPERPILASLDPTTPVRQASQAVSYTVLLAQETLSAGPNTPEAPAAASIPAPTVTVAETSAGDTAAPAA